MNQYIRDYKKSSFYDSRLQSTSEQWSMFQTWTDNECTISTSKYTLHWANLYKNNWTHWATTNILQVKQIIINKWNWINWKKIVIFKKNHFFPWGIEFRIQIGFQWWWTRYYFAPLFGSRNLVFVPLCFSWPVRSKIDSVFSCKTQKT